MPQRQSRGENPAVSFQFSGDLASEGQLDFYQASRFFYGASRFVYTLEHFRMTGKVPAKIGRRIQADFNIAAPQAGSWVAEVFGAAAPTIGAASGMAPFLEVPIKALMAWVFIPHCTVWRSDKYFAQLVAPVAERYGCKVVGRLVELPKVLNEILTNNKSHRQRS